MMCRACRPGEGGFVFADDDRVKAMVLPRRVAQQLGCAGLLVPGRLRLYPVLKYSVTMVRWPAVSRVALSCCHCREDAGSW
jgi:hypothetical protein